MVGLVELTNVAIGVASLVVVISAIMPLLLVLGAATYLPLAWATSRNARATCTPRSPAWPRWIVILRTIAAC